MPDPNPRRQLLAELEAERRRPVPPPGGWPHILRDADGRRRMRWLLAELDVLDDQRMFG